MKSEHLSFILAKKTAEQLEFDKILSMLANYCKGDQAVNDLKSNPFIKSYTEIDEHLNMVEECVDMRAAGDDIALMAYEDLSTIINFLRKQGYVLEAADVISIGRVLFNYDLFFKLFNLDRIKTYPNLFRAGELSEYTPEPLDAIHRIFDDQGLIKPNASPQLSKIFKRIEQATRQVDRVFDEIMAKYKGQNVLGDTGESWRNGRRVLVLPAENKRRVPGVIHDQSSTGKTFFIEPQEIIQINNDLFSLENEKRAEVYKILKDLSALLHHNVELIHQISLRVARIDIIRAKAIFARRMDAVRPSLSEDAVLKLHQVKHPLLVLKHKEGGDEVVPFDLELKGQNKLLLISGPNAGGKSVTLKAVGLCHAMIYAGMLIPVDSTSVIGMFNAIFTDIGDQQSIDDGLSTYSSHLTNLHDIVRWANKKSLVLLDEIGSGTDPKLGGAIAEGILKALIAKKISGVVTTHYSSLKIFAFKSRGILNGAMLFDKDSLSPTYKLKVGKPGSSYAFEVARKIGMDDRILNYARKKVGTKENEVEDLLINLQQQKMTLDDELIKVAEDRERLDKLIQNYETLSGEFQVKRKKLQIRAKELEVNRVNEESRQIQDLIKKLHKEKNLEAAEAAKKAAIEKRQLESVQIKSLKKEVYHRGQPSASIVTGDFVRMIDGDMSGEVLSVQKKKATVLFGLIKMNVPLVDLIHAKDPLDINRQNRINVRGVAFDHNFSPKLDIRGYKMEDADRTLQEFFDRALMSNVRTLEVVHGKGSGVLRKLVQKKMKEYKDIDHSWHPAEEQGGEGVTLIKL